MKRRMDGCRSLLSVEGMRGCLRDKHDFLVSLTIFKCQEFLKGRLWRSEK